MTEASVAEPCVGCQTYTKLRTYSCFWCGKLFPLCYHCYHSYQNVCRHITCIYVCYICNLCDCRKIALAFAALHASRGEARNAWADVIEWVVDRML